MVDEDTRARMRALEEKLARRKRADAPTPKTGQGYSGAELAWRMVIELVSGLGIGFGIGYGIDSLMGTMPIFLVLFVFLGFAAGIKVMMNTAKSVYPGDETPDGKSGGTSADDGKRDGNG